jgi:hypothetical protein
LPRIARERVPTIASASPNRILKPRGLFVETLSIRPRSGSNPRLSVQLTFILSYETEQDIRQALSAGAKAFLVKGELRQEIAMGLVRQTNIPGLRIQLMFSWALPSGELGGLAGEFYQFANSIRSELSAVSVRPLK